MLEPDRLGQQRTDLAQLLRDLRRAAGLAGDRLASRAGMSQSKISKIENGRILPSVLDVERILGALGVTDQVRQEVLDLTKVANVGHTAWRAYQRAGLHHKQDELSALEASSKHLRYLLPTLITGLLQTPEYARRTLSSPLVSGGADFSLALTRRIERQHILHSTDRQFSVLLTEPALRWRVCSPAAMAAQLDHLSALACLPNVSIRVLPLTTSVPFALLNGFVIYDDRLVTIEATSGEVVLRDPRDIKYHAELFEFVGGLALGEAGTIKFLTTLTEEFRTEAESFSDTN